MAEFGVFVDTYGRRSRTDELKWSRLPLTFGTFVLRQILCLKKHVPDHFKDIHKFFYKNNLKIHLYFIFLIPSIPQLSESRTCL